MTQGGFIFSILSFSLVSFFLHFSWSPFFLFLLHPVSSDGSISSVSSIYFYLFVGELAENVIFLNTREKRHELQFLSGVALRTSAELWGPA